MLGRLISILWHSFGCVLFSHTRSVSFRSSWLFDSLHLRILCSTLVRLSVYCHTGATSALRYVQYISCGLLCSIDRKRISSTAALKSQKDTLVVAFRTSNKLLLGWCVWNVMALKRGEAFAVQTQRMMASRLSDGFFRIRSFTVV